MFYLTFLESEIKKINIVYMYYFEEIYGYGLENSSMKFEID